MTSWTNSGSGPSATAAGRKVSELFPCFGAAAGASDSSVFAPAAAPRGSICSAQEYLWRTRVNPYFKSSNTSRVDIKSIYTVNTLKVSFRLPRDSHTLRCGCTALHHTLASLSFWRNRGF